MARRMTKKKAALIGGAVVLLGGIGAGAAIASNDDAATQQPITGPALQKATDAALAETGGGRVSETEVNDEEGYYQVEVTLDSGKKVDVNLTRDFKVIRTSTDHEDNGGS